MLATSAVAKLLKTASPKKPTFNHDSFTSDFFGGLADSKPNQTINSPSKPSYDSFWGNTDPKFNRSVFGINESRRPEVEEFTANFDFDPKASLFQNPFVRDTVNSFDFDDDIEFEQKERERDFRPHELNLYS